MAQTITIPHVGDVDFPDNMSSDDISAAIQKNYPQIHGHTPDALDDMSTSDKMVVGMGKAFHDTYLGGKQLYAHTMDYISPQAGQSRTAAAQQEVDTARDTDKHLMTDHAAMAGNVLGNMAMAVAAPEGMAGAAVGGAVLGGLQPTGADESHLQNAALGGAGGAVGQAAGQIVGKVAGRIMQPFRTVGSPEMEASVNAMNAAGVPLTAAQQLGYGSKQVTNAQRQAFTGAVLRQLGTTSETADAATMQTIRGTLGTTFDAIAARSPVNIDSTLTGHLQAIEAQASKELTADQMRVLQNQIDNIHDMGAANGGSIPGAGFTNLREILGRLQSDKMQPVRNFWLDKVEDSLHDAMTRSASPGDAQLLAQTRQGWRALKQVEPAIDSENYISPSALYKSMDATRNANQSTYGQGPQQLMELAQAGKNVMSNGPAQFWTTSRLLAYGQIGAQLGAAEELMRGNVKGAGALAGIAGGKVVLQAAMENPKVGAMVGSWAKSQILSNWRQTVTQQAARLGGEIGGSAIPIANANSAPTPQGQ